MILKSNLQLPKTTRKGILPPFNHAIPHPKPWDREALCGHPNYHRGSHISFRDNTDTEEDELNYLKEWCLVGEVQATWHGLSLTKVCIQDPQVPQISWSSTQWEANLSPWFCGPNGKKELLQKGTGFSQLWKTKNFCQNRAAQPSVCSGLECNKDDLSNILYLFQIALGEIFMVPRNVEWSTVLMYVLSGSEELPM